MAGFYIIGTMIIVLANIQNIGPTFAMIFEGAFGDWEAAGGGIVGFSIMTAMQRGFSRGIFSNEAGLGSAPVAHAAADTKGQYSKVFSASLKFSWEVLLFVL